MTDLLYNGFYCFEVITERKLDDQICGICGIVGEIYLGDGNQKNCCSRKEVPYNADHVTDKCMSQFSVFSIYFYEMSVSEFIVCQ